MFGQQNDKPVEDNKIPDQSIDGAMNDDQSTSSSNDTQPNTSDFQHPGMPLDDNKSAADTGSLSPEVISPDPSQHSGPNPASEHHGPSLTTTADSTTHDLIDIKQKALSQLTPLVGHLDQSPEEKFKTTMMMIQASDDQSLVQSAYDTAQKIEDEKTRAQALLDIINEINYFTQHASQ